MGPLLSSVKVLCVDDNPDILESQGELLGMVGFNIRMASSGNEALEIAQSFQPDVCLLDLNMPGMSGYELAPQLRSLVGPEVYLIAISAASGDKHERLIAEARFDLEITKPADPMVLVNKLKDRVPVPRLPQE